MNKVTATRTRLDAGEKVTLTMSEKHSYLVIDIEEVPNEAKAEGVANKLRGTGQTVEVTPQSGGRFLVQVFLPLTQKYTRERG